MGANEALGKVTSCRHRATTRMVWQPLTAAFGRSMTHGAAMHIGIEQQNRLKVLFLALFAYWTALGIPTDTELDRYGVQRRNVLQ